MIDKTLVSWLEKLCNELDRRLPGIERLDQYDCGDHPIPRHVTHQDLETEYKVLMAQAVTNWPELVRKSVSQRLGIDGFRFATQQEALRKKAWGHWQRNNMDAGARLINDKALANGRAFAIVWNGPDGKPSIVPESAKHVVVAYSPTGQKLAALRRWESGGRWYATLYLPEGIYKFQGPEKTTNRIAPDKWEERQVKGESWPLTSKVNKDENGVVPVVEFAVNRDLTCGEFGSARAEIAGKEPIVDRINTTIFSGLLAQTYSAFPVRALIGDKIKYEAKKDANGDTVYEDDGTTPVMEPVPPVKLAVNRLIQIENEQGKLIQLPEANLDNYIKFAETHIRHLAAITQTPAHYLLGEMVNLSADAIRAAEAGLISKIKGHQIDLGEAYEEVVRLTLRMDDPDVEVPDDIETRWKDAESRSLAERADAWSKLADLPTKLRAEIVLGLSAQEIDDAEASGALSQILTERAPLDGQPTG